MTLIFTDFFYLRKSAKSASSVFNKQLIDIKNYKSFLNTNSTHLAASLAVVLSWSYSGFSSTTSTLINLPEPAIHSKTLKASSGEKPIGEGALTPGA
jgi:hypothetical protein